MYLEEGAEIKGYTVVKFIAKRDDGVIYETIKNISGERLFVCEYFPEGLAERNEDGSVNILNASEYTKGLSYFRSRSDTIRSIGFKEIIKIKETLSFHNTYYAFYGISEGQNLLAYVESCGGKISYKNAYSFLSPLIRSLNYMYNNNVFFRPSMENIKYMPDNSVILDDFYLSNYSYMYCIEDLANVFYTLITGKKYADILERPSKAGGYLSKRLDDILYDTLFSNVSYSSLEDFLNKVTDSVIFDNNMAGEQDYSEKPPVRLDIPEPLPAEKTETVPPEPKKVFQANEVKGEYVERPLQNGPPHPQNGPPHSIYSGDPMYSRPYNMPPKRNNNKLLIGCIGAGCFSLIVLFVVIVFAAKAFFGIAQSYSTGYTEERIPEYLYDEDKNEAYRDHEEYVEEGNTLAMTMAYTSYAYNDSALDNTVTEHDGFVYFRHWDGANWGIARYHKTSQDPYEMIATGVMANFMQIKDNRLYYVDGFQNNYVFSVDINGAAEPELIISQKAAFIQLHEGKLYYINLDDGFFIYRANTDGSENELFNPVDTSAMALMDDELIYLGYEEEGGLSLFSINVNTLDESFISSGWARNIICKDGIIYYVDYDDDTFHMVDIEGNELPSLIGDGVFAFGFSGDDIYYIDMEFHMNKFNRITGETEAYPYEAYYLQTLDGAVFYYEYYDELLYRLDQNGETHSLYEGYPAYPESRTD